MEPSEHILAAARASLENQRAGGRRLRHHQWRGEWRMGRKRGQGRLLWLILGIVLATMIAGVVLTGVLLVGALVLAGWLVTRLVAPSRRRARPAPPPSRDALAAAPLAQMTGQARDWLAAQSPALPAPARDLAATIGHRLDTLAPLAANLADDHPSARPLRQLLGENLPELVSAYRQVPAPLRAEPHLGISPDDSLIAGLTKIAAEIETATQALAEGSLDRLAVHSRYLDSRYGETIDITPKEP